MKLLIALLINALAALAIPLAQPEDMTAALDARVFELNAPLCAKETGKAS